MSRYDVPTEIFKSFESSCDQILRWASREGLMLYEGLPDRKFPIKDYYVDGWCFRPWSRHGPALARIPSDMLILDSDTEEGRAAVAELALPDHFAIRSLKSGGEKHFFRMEGPPRRVIRALPGLDILTNPDFKYIWAKIDNGGDGGYRVISDTEDVPDFPPEVLAAIRRAKGSLAAPSAVSGRPTAAGASLADGDELMPTAHYLEHGIPRGIQEDRLYRLADRFAAQSRTEAQGTQLLTDIIMVSEQDDSDPWTTDQLRAKMHAALAWIAAKPADCKLSSSGEELLVEGLGGSSSIYKNHEREFAHPLTRGSRDRPRGHPGTSGPSPAVPLPDVTGVLSRHLKRRQAVMVSDLALGMREDHARRLAAAHFLLIGRAISVGSDILDWSRRGAVEALIEALGGKGEDCL